MPRPDDSRGLVALSRKILAFGMVGVIGFVIDATVLYVAKWLGIGLVVGRIASYLTAASSTWALNRRFTFGASDGPMLREWALFMVSQLFGAVFNLGVYWWLIVSSTVVAAHPVLGVAAGSMAGMSVNFVVAHKFVFKQRRA